MTLLEISAVITTSVSLCAGSVMETMIVEMDQMNATAVSSLYPRNISCVSENGSFDHDMSVQVKCFSLKKF